MEPRYKHIVTGEVKALKENHVLTWATCWRPACLWPLDLRFSAIVRRNLCTNWWALGCGGGIWAHPEDGLAGHGGADRVVFAAGPASSSTLGSAHDEAWLEILRAPAEQRLATGYFVALQRVSVSARLHLACVWWRTASAAARRELARDRFRRRLHRNASIRITDSSTYGRLTGPSPTNRLPGCWVQPESRPSDFALSCLSLWRL
jgi:hypothetical protein